MTATVTGTEGAPGTGAVDPSAEVARLRATFAGGRTRDRSWRVAQLRGLERMLAERESEFAQALASDLGRPAVDAWLADLAPTTAESVYARKHLARWMKPRRVGLPLSVQPGRARYEYEPLGVVLVIGPWNYPAYLTLSPLVAAFAAGNCAVVKPSEYAPAIAELLRQVDVRAIAHVTGGGLPGHIVRVLPDDADAVLDTRAWEAPRIFGEIQRLGDVALDEMRRVFNCGIGMVLVVPPD
ncbi:MAG: aldehyde dehydrogenase family protein, partial [Aeromicrobium sp.]